MKEPRRLRGDAGSDLERRLLGAGRARAPREARQRALVAATAALGTTAAATGAAAATSGAASTGAAGGGATAGGAAASTIAKTGGVAMLKWLSVVALAGIGAATAAVSMQHAHPASETAATAVKAADAARVVALSKAPRRATPGDHAIDEARTSSAAASVDVPPPPPPPPSHSSPAPTSSTVAMAPPVEPRPSAASPAPPSGSTLPAELAMLDEARSAMTGGDPARALSILDGYTGRFPHASLGAEATVLRIEALIKAGDPAAAHRTADAFLAANPRSPYAERIRTLLGESNP